MKVESLDKSHDNTLSATELLKRATDALSRVPEQRDREFFASLMMGRFHGEVLTVAALDAKSFVENSDHIANAVRVALANGHPLAQEICRTIP